MMQNPDFRTRCESQRDPDLVSKCIKPCNLTIGRAFAYTGVIRVIVRLGGLEVLIKNYKK
jgi:hypothetical protein